MLIFLSVSVCVVIPPETIDVFCWSLLNFRIFAYLLYSPICGRRKKNRFELCWFGFWYKSIWSFAYGRRSKPIFFSCLFYESSFDQKVSIMIIATRAVLPKLLFQLPEEDEIVRLFVYKVCFYFYSTSIPRGIFPPNCSLWACKRQLIWWQQLLIDK